LKYTEVSEPFLLPYHGRSALQANLRIFAKWTKLQS
jgi:hypothetical protein